MRLTLALLLVAPALAQESDPVRRCGSEIPWKRSIEEASVEARTSGRPILWYVPTVDGTAMDRKDVVEDCMRCGPWMMRDVVSIVTRRFIPVQAPARGATAKKLGLERLVFIEPGLVFLDAELKPIHKVDRLSTFSEEWFVHLFRQVLAKHPGPAAREAGAAELLARGDFEAALKKADTPLLKAAILRRLRKGAEAEAALKEAGDGPDVKLERARLLLNQARWRDAHDLLTGLDGEEAAFLLGAAKAATGRDAEAVELWKRNSAGTTPWAWKSAAEAARKGPLLRGFEELAWLPEAPIGLPATTTRPRASKDLDLVTRRSLQMLHRTQRASGRWDDSVYVFGGLDSLPNVYMAGTAIAAMALTAWREIDPGAAKAAVDRAWPYLLDEKNTAPEDEDEIIWAHLYRLHALVRIAGAWPERKADAASKMAEIVGKIAKLQKRPGIWQHEYDNPFATASVILALDEARRAGVEIPPEVVVRGVEALGKCRGPGGTFSYSWNDGAGPVQGSAGRMPLCELALLVGGKSTEDRVRAAVAAGFERHDLLERVRKYDDHADAWHNGGFFFWYDMLGRAEAIRRLRENRDALLAKQRDLVLAITEIDGAFVDSHELGKSYGTAMALLTLKACEK